MILKVIVLQKQKVYKRIRNLAFKYSYNISLYKKEFITEKCF